MKEIKPIQPVCAFAIGKLSPVQLTEIHQCSKHLGVKQTLYFACRICVKSSSEMNCEEYQSIDPAPEQ